jgi:hypothetical protein
LLSQVDTGLAVVRNDEAMPVAMALDPAFEFAHQGRAVAGGVCLVDVKILGS